MTVPAVRAIKRGRPDAHITLLTPAKLADMWENVPEVDDVIPFLVPSGRGILKSIRGLFTLFSAAGEVRKGGPFEVAILFPNSLRTALEVWLAGIPRRIGFEGHGMRKWLLNQVLRPAKAKKGKPALADPPVHQVNHYLKLVTFVGGRVEDGLSAEPDGEIHAPPSGTFAGAIPPEEAEHPPLPEQEIEGERIGGIGLGLRLAPVHPVLRQVRIGVCPGAEYGPAKRWFPERFAEVMTMIDAEYRCAWVLFGAARDVPVAAAMEPLLAGLTVENLVGRTTMAELIDELRRCHLLLTNDTGTMHLAALLGVRTVSIFGSTEPLLTGPLGPDHLVIRHQVECSPCFLRTCPIDFRCMKTIDAFEVAATVSAALEQGVPNLES
jgi:ADP-heptose:LPS heptosyltransferase